MEEEIDKSSQKDAITIKTSSVIGSIFSQIVGVVVTDTDITLEFVYINPRPPIQEGMVVARITLPRQSGEELANAIKNTVKEHQNKKKGEK